MIINNDNNDKNNNYKVPNRLLLRYNNEEL